MSYPPPQPYERVLCGYCITGSTSGKMLVDIVALPEATNINIGIVDCPLILTSSLSGSGIFTVGTGSVNLNTLSTGKGTTKNYPLAEKEFYLTASVGFLDVWYVMATYNSGSPEYILQTSKDSADDIQTTLVYTILLGAGGLLSYTSWDCPGILLANKLHERTIDVHGIEREDGLTLGVSGSSTYVTITSGHVYQGVNRFELSNVDSNPLNGNNRLVQIIHSGSTNVFSGSRVYTYNTASYDNGTGIQPIGNKNWCVNWVYRAIGSLNTSIIMLGDESYTSLPAAVESQPPAPPAEMGYVSLLVGRTIWYVQSGLGSLVQTDSAFDKTYTIAGVTNHNNLLGLQGGAENEYYHLTSASFSGTGTGVVVRQIQPSVSSSLEIITQATSSLIMTSGDGSRWNIWIGNNGQFSSSKIV